MGEPETQPWEDGISAATRAQALELFRTANAHFAESEYSEAARGYRAALEVWDHPRIQGNLATALIYLDSPLDALRHLRAALKFGAAPFAEHVYQQLLTNQRLLLQQLARVTVRCRDVEAAVRIDGGDGVFGCPGEHSELLNAGNHELVASKPGHVTFTRAFTAVGGTETVIEIQLTPVAEAATYERRWAIWMPWLVMGSGVIVAGLGIPFRAAAIDARDRYEAEIETCPAGGCGPGDISPTAQALPDQVDRWNRLSWSMFAIGAAAAISGVGLLIANRERRVEVDESGQPVSALPIMSPQTLGLSVHSTF